MPVCEKRFEARLPLKMAEYNLPLHVQTEDEEFGVEENYHANGMTSPHDLGPWMEDQSDGGGKFRLKRRRRCGQCGPCQVKENCGKCQYCVRKDVLKQACIYRKCIYLRKPVPRFRPDAAGSSSGSSSGVGAGENSSSNVNKGSPHKVSSTPSTLTNHGTHPPPSPFSSSVAAAAAAAAAAQSAELSSCRLAQSPFRLAMNNGVIDPLRGNALDQHRSALFDASGVLDPTRSSYLASARGLDSARSPVLDLGRNTNTADSGIGTGSSSLPTPPVNNIKDRPTPGDQYRSPMEQWSAMPYGFPRNPWTHPALQHNPAAYGFQSGASPFPSPFASSCRLGMPDPTSHFARTPQPTFHHNMHFARPDLTTPGNFGGAPPGMRPTMTTPFYPPPPHIPSSLPNFPSFNQLPSSAGPHGTYPMPHPPMYPSNFYSSFRPPNEPQIYHAQFTPPEFPFMDPSGQGHTFFPFLDKFIKLEKDREDVDNELQKKFSIFCIPDLKKNSMALGEDCESLDFSHNGVQKTPLHLHKHIMDLSLIKRHSNSPKLDNSGSKADMESDHRQLKITDVNIDEDLQQQIRKVSGKGECDIISIDDFKMQAFIRSDGFNNLEIEIDTSLSPTGGALYSPYSYFGGDSLNSRPLNQQNFSKVTDSNIAEKASASSCVCEIGTRESVTEDDDSISDKVLEGTHIEEENAIMNECTMRTLSEDTELCVKQDLGEDGVVQVQVAGSKVLVEEVVLDDDMISLSSDPDDLFRFLGQPVLPTSPITVSDSDQTTCLPS